MENTTWLLLLITGKDSIFDSMSITVFDVSIARSVIDGDDSFTMFVTYVIVTVLMDNIEKDSVGKENVEEKNRKTSKA